MSWKNNMTRFKLYENVFIETNILPPKYDGVIIILYPPELNVEPPRHIKSFINNLKELDKHVMKTPTVWNCDYVSGGRLILAPTGKITRYHDARVLYEAAKKGMKRALDAGVRKPLMVVQQTDHFPDGQLVAILGALEVLYTPLHAKIAGKNKADFIGFHAEEKLEEHFERIVRNAIALELSRIVTRDISAGDPEEMSPAKIVDYIRREFDGDRNCIDINVIEDEEVIATEYPLLAAVNRAANAVDRHKARIVELTYKPSNIYRITETLMLVGKGVSYDTGGADIKISGKMAGMSRDKCGAAAVAGFLKACAILKPPHLKVIGVLCLCRNSVGSESYVADELLMSKSGKTVRVTNTDAEGRLAMADALFDMTERASRELNPHIYTIATLTGHARVSYGANSAAMDNHSARATSHASKLQFSGSRIAEGVEVSVVRPEDLDNNAGVADGDDMVQVNMKQTVRHHQLAAGFLIKIAGLDDKNVKYTHLDIAGACGSVDMTPTAVPVLTLCHAHKVIV
ncbi:putative aminopeptidase W07G4.4 [Plutella xylostella]|uniref:putative aminopeptidase W07G4.4 n=1 Tax=Plutella xylostella TaxID=51655 RepID=UPI002032AD94|nr:putative aminopeptidase W07G4.4 [Plutella xylostella]